MKVLIVDDTNTDRVLLKLYLSKLDCVVIEAHDGQEAIDLFLEHGQDLDLILMDVTMPNVSGIEAVKAIRSIQESQKQEWLPVIFLSASSEEESIVEGILAGGDDYLIKPISQKILSVKMLAMQRIADMRRRLVETNLALERLASTDYLTGVASRRAFESALEQAMLHFREIHMPFACGMFDLDKFKAVNDTFGHDAGDEVLIKVVQCVRASLNDKVIIGRLGGEEFGVILENLNEADAFAAFDKVRKYIESHVTTFEGHDIPVTVSIGVAMFHSVENDNINTLIKRADQALYEAKRSGRNRVIYHARNMVH
ncbi:diguanylate cyclase [Marinomonas sp. A79]|uniref:diguanylate cyclase n=1 Tax=Marinomonas vulgaris TaxID=2823372 RepID=A0ABS5HEQ8_9GAMM|nr:diguanylate cyclase [Marinomonas vulgaris]MBR7889882.1 diguanylate cyclase [Marinomonas vulgaris]